MPQMSPLNWLGLYVAFSFLYGFMIVLTYHLNELTVKLGGSNELMDLNFSWGW